MSESTRRIRTIACVGAGTIGYSWAVLFAGKGFRVLLQDINEAAIALANSRISSSFRQLVKCGLLSRSDAKDAMNRITCVTNFREAVEDADYVQESVPESMRLKREVSARICSIAPGDSIVASSTGGLPMSRIQSAVSSPERCVVVHPCQIPVHLTRLVEIVPGRYTAKKTVAVADGLMNRVGKVTIVLKREFPDYITNRLQFTLWREAIDMVAKGIASAEDIDSALCEMARASHCIGLGPFLQAHLHGGPHGAGGIEAAMKYYARILPDTWKSLAKWTRIPAPAVRGVNRSVRELVTRRGVSDSELRNWRDRKLLSVARSVWLN